MSLKRSRFTELSSRIGSRLVCATRVTAAGCCTCVVVVIPALLRRVRSARSAEITHPKTPRAAAHAYAHDSRVHPRYYAPLTSLAHL